MDANGIATCWNMSPSLLHIIGKDASDWQRSALCPLSSQAKHTLERHYFSRMALACDTYGRCRWWYRPSLLTPTDSEYLKAWKGHSYGHRYGCEMCWCSCGGCILPVIINPCRCTTTISSTPPPSNGTGSWLLYLINSARPLVLLLLIM